MGRWRCFYDRIAVVGFSVHSKEKETFSKWVEASFKIQPDIPCLERSGCRDDDIEGIRFFINLEPGFDGRKTTTSFEQGGWTDEVLIGVPLSQRIKGVVYGYEDPCVLTAPSWSMEELVEARFTLEQLFLNIGETIPSNVGLRCIPDPRGTVVCTY